MLVTPSMSDYIDSAGVYVYGARIQGKVDLSDCKTDVPLRIRNSEILDGLKLSNAELRALDLGGSRTSRIEAEDITIHGDVDLGDKFHATDTVDFSGARIGGTVTCSDGSFDGGLDRKAKTEALSLNNANIKGEVDLEGLTARSEVDLIGLHTGGDVDGSSAHLLNAGADALSLDAAQIGGDVILHKASRRKGWSASWGRMSPGISIARADHFPTRMVMQLMHMFR
jgi:hypothetical protein